MQRTNHFELRGLEPFGRRQASYVIWESHLTRSDDCFDIRYAIDESGVCEGRPIDQSEMRQMAQCHRDLGFVQDRNAAPKVEITA